MILLLNECRLLNVFVYCVYMCVYVCDVFFSLSSLDSLSLILISTPTEFIAQQGLPLLYLAESFLFSRTHSHTRALSLSLLSREWCRRQAFQLLRYVSTSVPFFTFSFGFVHKKGRMAHLFLFCLFTLLWCPFFSLLPSTLRYTARRFSEGETHRFVAFSFTNLRFSTAVVSFLLLAAMYVCVLLCVQEAGPRCRVSDIRFVPLCCSPILARSPARPVSVYCTCFYS